VVVVALCAEVPDRRHGAAPRVPRAVQAGERDERSVDREAGDRVVRAEVALARRALTGARDRADDPGLKHLALQPLGGDVPPSG